MRSAIFRLLVIVVGGGWGGLPPAAVAVEDNYGGLAEGPGRAAVYFTCRACHSVKQFTQQRMPREDWDRLIATMVTRNGMAKPEPWARTLILNYLATHFGIDTEDWQGLPPGPGREQVFNLCQACHSLALVKQQGLSRDSWDELLTWMVEEMDMPRSDAADRKLILDYLSSNLSITRNLRPKRR